MDGADDRPRGAPADRPGLGRDPVQLAGRGHRGPCRHDPLAARRLAEQVELGERLAAIGFVVAAQAVELRLGGGAPTLGAPLRPLFDAVRSVVPDLAPGTTVTPDLEPLIALIRGGRFVPDA